MSHAKYKLQGKGFQLHSTHPLEKLIYNFMNEFSPLFICYFFFFHQFFWHLNQMIKRTYFCFSSKHVKAIKKHILLILNEFHVTNFFFLILLLCYLNLMMNFITTHTNAYILFLPFYKKCIILKTVVH